MKENLKPKKTRILKVKNQLELMEFLTINLIGKSRNNIKSLLTHGQISVEDKITTQYNQILNEGQEVKINWNVKRDAKKIKGIKILFEDDDIIVIDKESGILSVSTGSKDENTAYNKLKNHVKSSDPQNKIFIVHRLDKNTSGVMMFAKTAKMQQLLQSNWKKYITNRKYSVLVEGLLKSDKGSITSWLKENSAFVVYSNTYDNGGKKATTNYIVIEKNRNYTLLEASLETGRKNQIRVHMQDLDHPIVGDKKYGSSENPIKRLGLHARVLEFIHPVTNKKYKFETKTPMPFTKLIKKGVKK